MVRKNKIEVKKRELRQKSKREEPPLEDKLMISREKRVKALIEKIGGKWKALGEELYKIYKEDKEEAFGLINAINTKLKIKQPKVEYEELEKWLNLLVDEKLAFSLDDKEMVKAVLGLATFSGLKGIGSEENVKKSFAMVVLKEAMKSNNISRRETAAWLIIRLGLQKELKAELMLLMFDGISDVREVAKKAWKKAGFGNAKAVYERMKEEEKERVKELIREAARSDDLDWGRRYAAAKLIGELGLQEEFLDKLVELVFDEEVVAKAAAKALNKWSKRLRKRGISAREELEKRKQEWKKEIKERIRKLIEKGDFHPSLDAIRAFRWLEDYKPELLLLSFVEDKEVKRVAKMELLKRYGVGSLIRGKPKLTDKERDELKQLVEEVMREGDNKAREAAVKLALKLKSYALLLIVWPYLLWEPSLLDEKSAEKAKKYMRKLFGELRSNVAKRKESKASLANPFALSTQAKLVGELALAMAVLCL